MEIRIKPMTFDHLDQMVELENRCFSIPWSREMLSDELINEHAIYYVAVTEDDTLIGYIGMHVVFDQAYITNIAVSPDFRQLGIGKALLSRAIETCKDMDVVSTTLEVRESNEIALSLYRSFGFKPVGKRISYYRNPTEDALIMLLNFSIK
ncbi:MAG: ribosomal protein S18-alanine N-acetyltransferase [Eubacteriales bacterium]|jgi:ribosomal-protein-alanine N-acetyltransferase